MWLASIFRDSCASRAFFGGFNQIVYSEMVTAPRVEVCTEEEVHLPGSQVKVIYFQSFVVALN